MRPNSYTMRTFPNNIDTTWVKFRCINAHFLWQTFPKPVQYTPIPSDWRKIGDYTRFLTNVAIKLSVKKVWIGGRVTRPKTLTLSSPLVAKVTHTHTHAPASFKCTKTKLLIKREVCRKDLGSWRWPKTKLLRLFLYLLRRLLIIICRLLLGLSATSSKSIHPSTN